MSCLQIENTNNRSGHQKQENNSKMHYHLTLYTQGGRQKAFYNCVKKSSNAYLIRLFIYIEQKAKSPIYLHISAILDTKNKHKIDDVV